MSTSLNFVAHPDDDLLFMGPDIAEEIQKGGWADVFYLTAGDDGNDESYVKQRAKAVRNAYAQIGEMYRRHLHMRSSSFRNGNIEGDLYRMWHDPNYLAKVPNEQGYTREFLLAELHIFIQQGQPKVIRIHNPYAEPALTHDEPALDHVDHIYAGKFALEAAKAFPHIPVYAYMGYPVRYQPPNLSAHQIELKTKMWRAYQSVDTSVAGEQWDIALSRRYKEKIQ